MNDRDEPDAVAMAMRMVRTDWHNSPERFNDLPPPKQVALRHWICEHLEPARDFNGRLHSYVLKHYAAAALGFYVGNGVMKGAMLAEGYTDYRAWGDRESPEINWTFRVHTLRRTRAS